LLIETSQAVVLATVGADGYPRMTADSFLFETARQKTKNPRRHPA
jgi:hypothetical protein